MIYRHRARPRLQDAGHEIQQSALAASRHTPKHNPFAVAKSEIHAAKDRCLLGEGEADSIQCEHQVGAGRSIVGYGSTVEEAIAQFTVNDVKAPISALDEANRVRSG